jgi:hypothetical protein
MKFAQTLERLGFLPGLVVASAAVVSLSVNLSSTAVALSPATESGVVGGDPCGFAAGVAGGLIIGGFFGCVPCAIGGGIIGLILLVGC